MRNERFSREAGFTLIELLVVVLIIGLLAAIAVPSFLNQRERAQDACTKTLLLSARTAMETYLTDHGDYLGVDINALRAIESAIPTAGTCGTGNSVVIGDAGGGACAGIPAAPSYCVGLISATGRQFVINRWDGGVVTRTCGAALGGSNGGGCAGGIW